MIRGITEDQVTDFWIIVYDDPRQVPVFIKKLFADLRIG